MLVTIKIGHSTIPSTKLFGNNCQIVKLGNIILVVEIITKLYIIGIWLSNFSAGQGVLNKGPTVQLGGAGPANTCIPPTFPSEALYRDNS